MEPAPDDKNVPETVTRLPLVLCGLLVLAALAGLLLATQAAQQAMAGMVLLLALALGATLLRQGRELRRLRQRVEALTMTCADNETQRLIRAQLAGVLHAARRISIISTDLYGVIRVFNAGAEHILGYSAAELVGRATPERFHLPREVEQYAQEVSARLGRQVRGFEAIVALVRHSGPEGYAEHRWTYVRKDGGLVPMELTVTGIYNDAGELEGFLGVGLDLRRRMALEAELRQAQISVDNAGDMILWSRAEDARVVYANQAASELLGYTRQELLNLTVFDFNPARTPENWRAHCTEVGAKGRTLREMTLRRKDGSLVPVETTSSLVEQGGKKYALGIMRDLTQRKALEAELLQAQVSVDNAQDMIFWVRLADRKVVFANNAACVSLGYTRQEILGLDVQTINPLRTAENWQMVCQRLLIQGQRTYEAVYLRKDGSSFPVETSSFLLHHLGQDYGVAIVRDITQRKEAENQLKFETSLNRCVAEAARALISAAPDMNAIAALLLDRACEITGSRHGYVAFIDQQSGGLQPRAMTAMMKSGECTLGALPVTFPPNPDGSYSGLWGHSLNTREGFLENRPTAHPQAKGLPEGHVAISQLLTMPALVKDRLVGQIALANPGRDYTKADLDIVASLADIFALGAEQILAQRSILAAKEEAELSSRAKSDFLANMTHEVRTPLNGMLGMLQVLQSTELSQEQREYADVARQSAERLNHLLNNVIDYARLDSAATEGECMSFPPTDLLHALRAVFEPQAKARDLAFSIQADATLPELVRSDPQALRQALTHLLDNALKFTPAGGIILSAGLAPGNAAHLVFCVEDTGIGIPDDKRAQVFEAFVQADSSITRTAGGAGLGLAIVRKLAERMGGGVEALDRPGGGTVMRLTIPVDCSAPHTR